jgi:MFS family permease
VLPIFGGIFLDMIGLRLGIMVFTTILTVGQAIFMIGGYKKSFGVMLAGRVVFGLGGESMSVAQSAIVSKWFKGKELAMALGLNISISRLGSVVNGIVIPQIYNKDNTGRLGLALLVGFFVCVFSELCAIFLIMLDKRADKVDRTESTKILSESDKFRWSDIKTFNRSFWAICVSCVLVYMAIFPFIQVASDMLQKRFGFTEEEAGGLFGIPYTISAATSPFLGILIDRFGRRGLLIIFSTVFLLIAHTINMFFTNCAQGEHCYKEIGPLVLVGIGYSLYAAALWGSIPYVVQPRTVGTAFGFCTAIQNAGMAVAPTIVGAIIDATADDGTNGYFWASGFWVCVCIIGIGLNLWLYFEDIRNNGGQLNKVHRGDALQDLITSPTDERRRLEIKNDINMDPNSKEYMLDSQNRDALKQ